MDVSALAALPFNTLALASSLFLVAAGLSLIFGVSRIVNFAHGSFFMLGLYLAYTLVVQVAPWLTRYAGLPPTLAYGLMLVLASLGTALLGAGVERLVLRRLYAAPELLQLLATFALVLVLRDAMLWLWGAEDLLGPRMPGLSGALSLGERRVPSYDLLLMAVGPLVWGGLWLLLHRTHFGRAVRAATQDREMLDALGQAPERLFTRVFALGCGLAGLAGALQLPREPANLNLDLAVIGDAFVVVVVGGMGSLSGTALAALLIAAVKAVCIAVGSVRVGDWVFSFSESTLVIEFVVMALVLAWRPYGLRGRAPVSVRSDAAVVLPGLSALSPRQRDALALVVLAALTLPWWRLDSDYVLVLAIEVCVAVLFAASLQFILGPGGLHSFGHAAFFGAGAYGAALWTQRMGGDLPSALLAGAVVAALVAWPLARVAVRLSGVYLSMLTLAYAQIVWAVVFQWDSVTGGSNGLVGVWPAAPWQERVPFYELTLVLTLIALLGLRMLLATPWGLALRAARDAPARAAALGVNVARTQVQALVLAAALAGLAGGLFVFSKGSLSPDVLAVGKSVDALLMVLLGGMHSLFGPWVGGLGFTLLQDVLVRSTAYWRATLGLVLLLLVLAFPQGLVGAWQRWRKPRPVGAAP